MSATTLGNEDRLADLCRDIEAAFAEMRPRSVTSIQDGDEVVASMFAADDVEVLVNWIVDELDQIRGRRVTLK